MVKRGSIFQDQIHYQYSPHKYNTCTFTIHLSSLIHISVVPTDRNQVQNKGPEGNVLQRSDDDQYVWPKHVANNKKTNVTISWVVFVNCIVSAWLTRRDGVAQIQVALQMTVTMSLSASRPPPPPPGCSWPDVVLYKARPMVSFRHERMHRSLSATSGSYTSSCLTSVCPCMANIVVNDDQQDATIFGLFIYLFLISSTCFGRCLRPSSRALDCIYSFWYCPPICCRLVTSWQLIGGQYQKL
jgi:hypothetical protein